MTTDRGPGPADPSPLLNRPMLERDLPEVAADPWARALRRLVAGYREQGLPVVNGGFGTSNLLEGPAQTLMCHPYRLWEYTSLFRAIGAEPRGRSFLDVGGAASPLPFLLAEHGARGVTLDRQPLLVCLSNHASQVRGLDLKAETRDAAVEISRNAEFDFATCISVLEHVQGGERPHFLRNIATALKPGGLLYLTFDYGDYVGAASSGPGPWNAGAHDKSLTEIAPLCEALAEAGFGFVGNDPRELPAEVLALRSAPRHAAIARRMVLTRRPFDVETPWSEVARYLLRRGLGLGRRPRTRYSRHNFFRLFVVRER